MTRIDIALGPIEIDGPMASAAERYLSVTASLRVVVGGVTVLDEPAVPILELASQLEKTDVEDGFTYTSVQSDYALLVVLPWRNGMIIASPMAGTCAEKPVTREAVRVAFKDLRHALDRILAARHIHVPRETHRRPNPFL